MTTRHSILKKYHEDLASLLITIANLMERCTDDGRAHAEKELACLGQVNYHLHESHKHLISAGQRVVYEIEHDDKPTYL